MTKRWKPPDKFKLKEIERINVNNKYVYRINIGTDEREYVDQSDPRNKGTVIKYKLITKIPDEYWENFIKMQNDQDLAIEMSDLYYSTKGRKNKKNEASEILVLFGNTTLPNKEIDVLFSNTDNPSQSKINMIKKKITDYIFEKFIKTLEESGFFSEREIRVRKRTKERKLILLEKERSKKEEEIYIKKLKKKLKTYVPPKRLRFIEFEDYDFSGQEPYGDTFELKMEYIEEHDKRNIGHYFEYIIGTNIPDIIWSEVDQYNMQWDIYNWEHILIPEDKVHLRPNPWSLDEKKIGVAYMGIKGRPHKKYEKMILKELEKKILLYIEDAVEKGKKKTLWRF